jgi:hypothetical protein
VRRSVPRSGRMEGAKDNRRPAAQGTSASERSDRLRNVGEALPSTVRPAWNRAVALVAAA